MKCIEPTPEMIDYIKKYFSYDAETGQITRSDRKNGTGSYDKDGYLIIKIKAKQFKAHRLAWFLHYGKFPADEIDHINRNRIDNRIENLRVVTRIENIRNTTRLPNKDTGFIGIYMDKATKGLKKKYTTRINKKTYRFWQLQDAVEFRKLNGYDC